MNRTGKSEQTNAKNKLKYTKILTDQTTHTLRIDQNCDDFPHLFGRDRTEYLVTKYSYRIVKWVRYEMESR